MHQPLYKDAHDGQQTLPWVRLHATKDYLHMADVLAEYPRVKATFNYVPSLVEQLEDYATGGHEDSWAALSRQECFSDADKRFMLDSFFSISTERFVKRYPRYWRLHQLRNHIDGSIELLSDAFWRDLAAWFNLAWIEPRTLECEPALAALVAKGGNYTREDLGTILDHQRRIAARVLPAYRDLQARGQVELSTSPYYHPILPLLLDTRCARDPSPNMTLPNVRFAHPEDALDQLRLGRLAHARYFGEQPSGLWPSEGALSDAVAALLVENGGWRWAATDEALLARSTGVGIDRDGYGHVVNATHLYRPYRYRDSDLTFVFRDRALSDRIGFVYRGWDGEDAANDLIHRLHEIRDRLADSPEPHLVSIVLDGENCWEEYEDNGNPFLHALYRRLSEDDSIETVTYSDYLREHPPTARLEQLGTGSWIFGNLETWIGESEQNRAWEFLALARDELAALKNTVPAVDQAVIERAWRELYVAEGSDWFWWYYSHNRWGHYHLFDQEFRLHLANIYRAIGRPVPRWLDRPIQGDPPVYSRAPTGYVDARLSTEPTPGLEWTNAGYLDAPRVGGAMQQGGGLLRRFYYGYNPATFYARLEANEDLAPYRVGIQIGGIWELAVLPGGSAMLCRAMDGGWTPVGDLSTASAKAGVLELAVPLDRLELRLGSSVELRVAVSRDGKIVEQLPPMDDDSGQLHLALASYG